MPKCCTCCESCSNQYRLLPVVHVQVIASSLTSLRSEILSDFTSREDLVECLKASANVPQIVGGPRNHRGHRLVDAAVFEPLPIKAALRDGCTHILALCSRPHKLEPAWSKYISTVLTNGIKYWLLNPVSTSDCLQRVCCMFLTLLVFTCSTSSLLSGCSFVPSTPAQHLPQNHRN